MGIQMVDLSRAALCGWTIHLYSFCGERYPVQLRRAVTREKLFADNVESFNQTFFSKDSIILWVIKTHLENQRTYTKLLRSEAVRGKQVVIVNSQREADAYLCSLS